MEDADKKGIIYCRVSSREQVEGTSLEMQERYCKEYAARNGIEVTKVFIEKGESAKTAQRTEFLNAINFCSSQKSKGKIDFFIVYKIDRFARNQDDHAIIRSQLRKYGTQLRSATEPSVDETPLGRMMEGVLAASAEFDNSTKSQRTIGGQNERLKQGFWPWGNPLGYYRPVKGANLAPDPQKAQFIELAFEEYAKGTYTYKALAEFLFAKGFKSKKGKQPCVQLIEKILKNKIYIRIMAIRGEEYMGTFPALVLEKTFYDCQRIRDGKSAHANPRSATNPLFPLRKLAICSHCEVSFTGSTSIGRGGKRYSNYYHYNKACSHRRSINKEVFESQFVALLKRITPDQKYEKLFKEIVVRRWKENYQKLDSLNAGLRRELEKLESQRQRIFELHQSGAYNDDEFKEQKAIVNQQIAEKHRLIGENRIEEFNMEEALAHCFSFVRDTVGTWKKAEHQMRLRFQKQIFSGKIKFDGEKFGTAETSLVYRLSEQSATNSSILVLPNGIEPLSGD